MLESRSVDTECHSIHSVSTILLWYELVLGGRGNDAHGDDTPTGMPHGWGGCDGWDGCDGGHCMTA